MKDFVKLFSGLQTEFLGQYLEQHLYTNQEYKRVLETAEEIYRIITEKGPEVAELLDLYDEVVTHRRVLEQDAAFMAGVKAVLNLIGLANNPKQLLTPPWSTGQELLRQQLKMAKALAGTTQAG